MSAHGKRLFQVAIAENLDASTGRNHTGLGQRFRRKGAFTEFRQALEIHDGVLLAEDIGEAALGDAAMQRHLPAFKAAHHARAGARTLAFVAAGGSLAHAAAHAASYALGLFRGAVAQLAQRVESGLDNVVWIGGAQRFGEHVLNARRSHDRAYRAAGDDPGAFRSGLKQHQTRTEAAEHGVRNGSLGEVYANQVLLGRLDALADGLRNFFGFAGTVAHHRRGRSDDHDQRRERHVLAALDDLGHAIDGHYLVFQLEVADVEFWFSC